MSNLVAEGSPEAGLSESACRWLTGLDRGMLASALVLGWYVLHAWLRGEFWWAKFNVVGALFYGPEVYTMGRGRATLAGVALLLILYSLCGTLFTVLARPRGLARNLALGLVWALVWHLVAQRWLWSACDPFGPAYFPVSATLPAHLLAGVSLGHYAARFRSLAGSFGAPDWQARWWPPDATVEAVEEPLSGTSSGADDDSGVKSDW